MKIWAVGKDPGGLAGLMPVVKLLRANHEVKLIANGKAVELLTEARESFFQYDSPEAALSEGGLPDIYITTMCTDGGLGHALVPIMRKHCPVVALQDFWGAGLLAEWLDPEYRPDYICLNDELGAELVLRAWPGYSEEQVAISGFPALDRYAGYDVLSVAEKTKSKLGLMDGRPIVLFAGGAWGTGQVFCELVQCLNSIGQEVYLIPRPHPRMADDYPKEMTGWERAVKMFQSGSLVLDPGERDIKDLVATASLVVSTYSTVLAEAATLTKPNISIFYDKDVLADFQSDTGGILERPAFVELACTAMAENREELVDLLEKSFSGELGRELQDAQQRIFRLDGKNAQRVVEFIEGLL